MPNDSSAAAPTLSVVTATYNSMRFFKETHESVLGLSVDSMEWVIVDDCSTDGTRDYLHSIDDPRVRLVMKEVNGGIEDSYRMGIAASRGRYVLILDHDDTLPAGTVEARIDALEENAAAIAALGPVNYMDEFGHVYKRASVFGLTRSRLLRKVCTNER